MEVNLDQVKRVHGNYEHHYGVKRTMVYVGKKLGWKMEFGVDIRRYDVCRSEIKAFGARLAAVLMTR